MSRALPATMLIVAVFTVASVAVIMSPPATVAAARETTLSPADCPGRLAGLPYKSGREIVDDEAGSVDLTCQYQRRQTRAGDPQVMVSLFYFTPAREPKGIGGFCWSLRDDLDDPEIVTESPPGGSLQPGGEHFIRVQYRAINHGRERVRKQAVGLAETLIAEGRVLPCPREDEDFGASAAVEEPPELVPDAGASQPPDPSDPVMESDPALQALFDAIDGWATGSEAAEAIGEVALEAQDEATSQQLILESWGMYADAAEQFADDVEAIQGLPAELEAVLDETIARARKAADAYRRAIELPWDSDEQLDAFQAALDAETDSDGLAARFAAALGVDATPDPSAQDEAERETEPSG